LIERNLGLVVSRPGAHLLDSKQIDRVPLPPRIAATDGFAPTSPPSLIQAGVSRPFLVLDSPLTAPFDWQAVYRLHEPTEEGARRIRQRVLRIICRYPAAAARLRVARTLSHESKRIPKATHKLPYVALILFYAARLPAYD